MTTVKFDKTVKYRGVRYPAHVAFDVADKDVEQLREAGATVLAVNPEVPELAPVSDGVIELMKIATSEVHESDENIEKMKEALLEYTLVELTQFAKDHNIDLHGKTRKADVYNMIVASLN